MRVDFYCLTCKSGRNTESTELTGIDLSLRYKVQCTWCGQKTDEVIVPLSGYLNRGYDRVVHVFKPRLPFVPPFGAGPWNTDGKT